jgi:hypothetical protein
MSELSPPVFLDTFYQLANTNSRSLTRLEKLLLDSVRRACILNPTEAFYDSNWVTTLLTLNRLYLEIDSSLVDREEYKLSILWVANWLLELLQRRPQLSANNIMESLADFTKNREALLDHLESTLPTIN